MAGILRPHILRTLATTAEPLIKAATPVTVESVFANGRFFNDAERDDTQGRDGNKRTAFHPLVQEGISIIRDINEAGVPLYQHFEYGGQQPGATAMKGFFPGDEMAILRALLGPDISLRILSRGMNGNNLSAQTLESLARWYQYENKYGAPIVLKQFHFLNYRRELQPALDLAHELGIKQEIAVPHAPLEFFVKSLHALAPEAAKAGAWSIKRMVAGLTEKEIMDLAPHFFGLSAQYGIRNLTLHTHGKTDAAAALFLQLGAEYAVEHQVPFELSVDITHKHRDPAAQLFPHIQEVARILESRGIKLPISDEQYALIEDKDAVYARIDELFAPYSMPLDLISDKDCVWTGIPDGGKYYSYLAVMNGRFHENFDMNKDTAFELFLVFYRFFRESFGMPLGVTPGHVRNEKCTIRTMHNMMPRLLAEAADQGKPITTWSRTDILDYLRGFDYFTLFNGIDPATVDALRDDYTPTDLTPETITFLRKTHMANFLTKAAFKGLTADEKDELIDAAVCKAEIVKVANRLRSAGKLPKAVLSDQIEDLDISLWHAAGQRDYLESDSAKDLYSANLAKIAKWRREGYIIECPDAELAEHGLPAPVPEAMLGMARADHEPMPSKSVPTAKQLKAQTLWQNDVVGKPGSVKEGKLQWAFAVGFGVGDHDPAFEKGTDWVRVADLSQ